MQFSNLDSGNKKPDEYQSVKVRFTENKFNFKFDPWLYGFAMSIPEPVKAYAWVVQPKKYWVNFDEDKREMNFCDSYNGYWASWGVDMVKRYLGKEIFDHFGKITFQVNGEMRG